MTVVISINMLEHHFIPKFQHLCYQKAFFVRMFLLGQHDDCKLLCQRSVVC